MKRISDEKNHICFEIQKEQMVATQNILTSCSFQQTYFYLAKKVTNEILIVFHCESDCSMTVHAIVSPSP